MSPRQADQLTEQVKTFFLSFHLFAVFFFRNSLLPGSLPTEISHTSLTKMEELTAGSGKIVQRSPVKGSNPGSL